MGLFFKDIKSMDDLFLHGLQDLYYAENQILKALPKLIEKASDAALKQGLQAHLGETKDQVKRLEQVFEMLDQRPKGEKCPAIDGILKEGDDTLGEIAGDDLLNVAMIAGAQAVEHYEMTRYGALIAWAGELGKTKCIPLLKKSLAEEKAADAKLTAIAERRVNPKPASHARRRPAQAKAQRKGDAGKSASKSAGKTAAKPTRKRA
jgi:ferritin-like metal-binding protein YciE